jgi:hypothetical protein
MDQIIKELHGHSGSKVYLMKSTENIYFVRKVNNFEKNIERLSLLHENKYPVPKIYSIFRDGFDMEYLHGLDMKTYLIHNNQNLLTDFILMLLKSFENNTCQTKDYTEVYYKKLEWLPNNFLFTKEELIDILPKKLPQTVYHGDLTLENLLYVDSKFFMIDPITTEYDSFIFDIAKLRQDLECKWFLRNSDLRLDTKLQVIRDKLSEHYPIAFENSLLILMLLRVARYCRYNDSNYQFLFTEIEKLWKKIHQKL